MKFASFLLFTSAISANAATTSLRGSPLEKDFHKSVQGWGQLKCMFEGFSNKEKCAESVNDDGEACSFCVMQSNGQEAGLCVDPEVAPEMEQLNPSISCDPDRSKAMEEEEEEADEDLQFVQGWGELQCMFEAFSDEEKCADSVNGDGEPCSYCVMQDGSQGLCVDPKVAPQMEQINPSISCNPDSSIEGDAEEVAKSSSVEGWGQLECMFEAFSNKEKCAESTNADGAKCSYCVMKGDEEGEQAGLCVDPALAPQMEQLNPALSCDSDDVSEEEEGLSFDYHDYKCSIKALTDPALCAQTKTKGGEEHCEFCTMDGPFGPQGLCVSPEHAEIMKGISPAVNCDTMNESSVSLAMK